MQIKFLSLAIAACLVAFASASPVNADSSIDMAAGNHLMRRQPPPPPDLSPPSSPAPPPPPGKLDPEVEKALSQEDPKVQKFVGIDIPKMAKDKKKDLSQPDVQDKIKQAISG